MRNNGHNYLFHCHLCFIISTYRQWNKLLLLKDKDILLFIKNLIFFINKLKIQYDIEVFKRQLKEASKFPDGHNNTVMLTCSQ